MTSSLAESIPGKTPKQWAAAFLKRIGAPTTTQNVEFVEKWMALESGGGGGLWNPLNSVLPAPHSTPYNSVGVQNYPTFVSGMNATVATFTQSQWSGVVTGLRSNDQFATENAINAEYATWGGGPLNIINSGLPPQQAGKGGGSSSSPGGGGSSAEHCIIRLPAQSTGILGKLPLVPSQLGGGCVLDSSQGRALLGAFSLVAGVTLVLIGLGFVAIGGNTGRQIARTVGPVAALA